MSLTELNQPNREMETDPFKLRLLTLQKEASKQLPDALKGNAPAAEAWVYQQVIGLSQLRSNGYKSMIAQLVDWIENNDALGQIWREHPEGYGSLTDFLKGVGSEMEGTNLSPSMISDVTGYAEQISPFCAEYDIPIRKLVSGRSWGKFREAIPVMKRTINSDAPLEDRIEEMKAITADLKALPTRRAVREKYRKQRADKPFVGDTIQVGDSVYVLLKVDSDDWKDLKGSLSRKTEWKGNMWLKGERKIFTPTER